MVLLFYNIFNFIVYFSTPLLFALETVGEHIIAELLTQNRREVVEKLWTKQAAKYTTSNSKSYLTCKICENPQHKHF